MNENRPIIISPHYVVDNGTQYVKFEMYVDGAYHNHWTLSMGMEEYGRKTKDTKKQLYEILKLIDGEKQEEKSLSYGRDLWKVLIGHGFK